jgi:hypothetical protein
VSGSVLLLGDAVLEIDLGARGAQREADAALVEDTGMSEPTASPALNRLIEEVRRDGDSDLYGYNRMHQRHNRSVHHRPRPEPKQP